MQKAASDLFIDQVREKIGPYGGEKLKGTFVEHSIIQHQTQLLNEIKEHYKKEKLLLQKEHKIAAASTLLYLYKNIVLAKNHANA